MSQVWTDGRLASKRLYNSGSGTNVSWLAYGYDANDNIGAIRDQLDDSRSLYYGYDANDRLSFASMTVGTPAADTESYSYTAGTNRMASVTSSAGTRAIGYDGRGNTSSETRPGGASVGVTYDGYGRLLTYSRTGDPAQTNIYNGLDDRVSMTSGGTTHLFVYDPDGRVIGEYGTSALDVIAETIWLQPEVASDNGPLGGDDGVGGYAPLAMATGSGGSSALYWLHGNHLGVPIVTTDAAGAASAPTGHTLLGFPGQLRTLADLYYNRHRDYDSSTGRYIQADPIGLEGDNNPYLYAEGNPLRYTDPLGLESATYDSNGRWRPPLKPDANPFEDLFDFFFGDIEEAVEDPTWSNIGWAVVCATPGGKLVKLRKFNPFKGKSAKQIDEMLRSKGYQPVGPDPLNGRGNYVNPRTGRGYHLDANHGPPKGPHVGAHRPRNLRDKLPPRDFPM